MKKIIILMMILMASVCWGADVKISELTAKAGVDLTMATDMVPVNVDGATRKVPIADLTGKANVIADANGRNLTAQECYGAFHYATGAGTWLLPAAEAGMNLCVVVDANSDVIVDVDGSDEVVLVGTHGTAGVGITNASGSSTGDFVCLVAMDAVHWVVMGKQGTWASQ